MCMEEVTLSIKQNMMFKRDRKNLRKYFFISVITFLPLYVEFIFFANSAFMEPVFSFIQSLVQLVVDWSKTYLRLLVDNPVNIIAMQTPTNNISRGTPVEERTETGNTTVRGRVIGTTSADKKYSIWHSLRYLGDNNASDKFPSYTRAAVNLAKISAKLHAAIGNKHIEFLPLTTELLAYSTNDGELYWVNLNEYDPRKPVKIFNKNGNVIRTEFIPLGISRRIILAYKGEHIDGKLEVKYAPIIQVNVESSNTKLLNEDTLRAVFNEEKGNILSYDKINENLELWVKE